jgi:hypothetical protein
LQLGNIYQDQIQACPQGVAVREDKIKLEALEPIEKATYLIV